MEELKSIFSATHTWASVALVIPLAAMLKWQQFWEAHWRLSSKRGRALQALLKGDKWRGVSDLELQSATRQALGRELTKADLAFAATRCRAVALLHDVAKAGGAVRIRSDGSGYERSKLITSKRTLGFWSEVVTAATFPIWTAAILFSLSAHTHGSFQLALNAVEAISVACMLHWISGHLAAAHRVLTLFGYPPLPAVPAVLQHPLSLKTKLKGEKRKKKGDRTETSVPRSEAVEAASPAASQISP
jgi:hypothetical protein